jgi:hypothetical protein
MNECSNVLDHILENPLTTIGDESIVKLKYFFDGYCMGAGVNWNDDPMLSRFQLWIAERHNTDSSLHWADVVFYIGGNFEYATFQRLKVLWAEFKTESETDDDAIQFADPV